MRETADRHAALVRHGRIVDGIVLAIGIIVLSYAAGFVLFGLLSDEVSDAGIGLALASPLPGLIAMGWWLHGRVRTRTLTGLAIGTLLMAMVLIVLAASALSDVHLGM